MISLPHRVAVYVPSTTNTDQSAIDTQRAQVDYVATKLSMLYGGCTAEDVTGYWISGDRGLVKETPIKVWAFCQEFDKADILALAEHLKTVMLQEAVLCELDNEGMLV
jgi:hypothetical protein